MKVNVKYYLGEYINGKWHKIDMRTDQETDIREIRLNHLLERPQAKLRIRKIEIPCDTIQL